MTDEYDAFRASALCVCDCARNVVAALLKYFVRGAGCFPARFFTDTFFDWGDIADSAIVEEETGGIYILTEFVRDI
jgi:hypothetical protein